MWNKIVDLAINNGLWAVLFLILLIYELRDSRKREVKYQQTIEKLSSNFDILKDDNENVKTIKEKVVNKSTELSSSKIKLVAKKSKKQDEDFKREA